MDFSDLLAELTTAFSLAPVTDPAVLRYPMLIDGMALQLCSATSSVDITATIDTQPQLLHEQPQLADRLLNVNRPGQGLDHPTLTLDGRQTIVLTRRIPCEGMHFSAFKQHLGRFVDVLEHCHRLVAEATLPTPPSSPSAMAALLRV